ncbi:MAG: ATP-binding cassette domain-containing protein [Thermomicrobiales bacterium]
MATTETLSQSTENTSAAHRRQVVLRTTGLTRSFTGNIVLNDVGIDIMAGEIHGLVGENGAGKSTWINLVTGVFSPDSGSIEFDGVEVQHLSPHTSEALGLATVHQELSLCPHLTVAENVFLGKTPTTSWFQNDYERMERESIEIFSRLGFSIDPRAYAEELPLAEQQVVELAKALISSPKVLILDEATSALDQDQVHLIFEALRELRDRGVAIIFVSHRLEELFAICDRITVLKNGEYVITVDAASTSSTELVQYMVGREIHDIFPAKPAIEEILANPVVLRARNLSSGRRFHNVDFDLHRGEILGLGGLNGQGQRELLAALFGVFPLEGELQIFDQVVTGRGGPRAAMTRKTAYVPEDRKTEGLIVQLPVSDNLALPNLDELANRGFLSRSRTRQLVDSLIAKLQIRLQASNQRVLRLSGGNQQKVAIAKWLARNPEILLLSEPTRGIDVGTKQEIHRLMRELTAAGASILLITSDTIELLGMSDRVLVMYERQPVVTLGGLDVTESNVVHASVVGRTDADAPGDAPLEARTSRRDKGIDSAPVPETRSAPRLPRPEVLQRLPRSWQDVLPILALTAVFAGIYLYLNRNTFSLDMINNLSAYLFPLFLASMAQSVIMLTGGIDLSVGNMMSLFTAIMATQMYDNPFSMAKAITMVLVGGAFIGLFTGAIVSVIRLPAIIVTLATSFIWAGAALWVLPVAGGHLPRSFSSFFIGQVGNTMPVTLLVLAGVLLIWKFGIKRTPIGLSLYAVGDNPRGAFVSGVAVRRARVSAYVIAGVMAGVAGIGLSAYAGSGDPLIGGTYTLATIAAAVLGGVSFLGGQGQLKGTVFGALSLGLMTQILFISGLSVAYQRVIYGVVLIVAIGIKTFAAFRLEERR